MRGRGWIRDIISQFIILVLLGVGLYVLYDKALATPAFDVIPWLKTIFIIAVIVFALTVVIFLFQVFLSVRLERFRPADPESLARLDRMRRFHLPDECRRMQATWPGMRSDLRKAFLKDEWGYIEEAKYDAVLERRRWWPRIKKPPYVDRVFIYYHPMMNVIIVDQMLRACERSILEWDDDFPAPRNVLLFLTDMDNRDEVTSAGAGVVNFLCRIDHGRSLYPMLLDCDQGRLFYPLDTTLIPRRHRVHFFFARRRLIRWIKQNVVSAGTGRRSVSSDPAPEADLLYHGTSGERPRDDVRPTEDDVRPSE